jgi:hypothetical protein
MAKESKVPNDLLNSKIEISPGLFIDDRLRVDGAIYLQDKTGISFIEFYKSIEKQKISDLAALVLSLIFQSNPGFDMNEAEKIVGKLDIYSLYKIVTKVFEFAPKNASEPNPQEVTENQPV